LDGIASLIHLVELVGVLVGFFLAFRAGRRLARYHHDAKLVKRYGRSLPGGIGLVFYILVLASLVVNVGTLLAVKLVTTLLKLGVAVATGDYTPFALGLGLTLLGILVGYAIFTLRYRSIEEPLTREGRLVLKAVQRAARVAEHVERVKQAARKGVEMLPKPPHPPKPEDLLRLAKRLTPIRDVKEEDEEGGEGQGRKR